MKIIIIIIRRIMKKKINAEPFLGYCPNDELKSHLFLVHFSV